MSDVQMVTKLTRHYRAPKVAGCEHPRILAAWSDRGTTLTISCPRCRLVNYGSHRWAEIQAAKFGIPTPSTPAQEVTTTPASTPRTFPGYEQPALF